MSHPHPSRRHVMIAYRQYILGVKRKSKQEQIQSARNSNPLCSITHLTGTARSLVHYLQIIQEYLSAKRDILAGAQ